MHVKTLLGHIEVFANKAPPKTVKLQIEDGEVIEVEVEYEKLPPCCSKCFSFGHIENQCHTKSTWIPKERPADSQGAPHDTVHNTCSIPEVETVSEDRLLPWRRLVCVCVCVCVCVLGCYSFMYKPTFSKMTHTIISFRQKEA